MVRANHRSKCFRSGWPACAGEIPVIWCTIASGRAAAPAAPTEAASSPSITTPSAPSRASRFTLAALVVVAVTWWPRATSCGTSRRPRTPVPPATNTRMIITFPDSSRFPQTLRRDSPAGCDTAASTPAVRTIIDPFEVVIRIPRRTGRGAPVSGGGTVTGKHEKEPPSGAVMSLLSRTGPEVPPDVADALLGAQPRRCLEEPTEILPVIAAAAAPRRRPPVAAVAARAVIVYESPPPRPWRLWAFTALLVALTAGVVLGQAVASEPSSRPAADARAAVVPSSGVPVAPQRVTAPLGAARTRLLEVTGAPAVLRIRSAHLGDVLLSVAAMDAGAAPRLADTARGPRLDLVPTGAAGTAGADVELNAAVSWTIRFTAGSAEQDIDMRAGGLAGVDFAGGAGHAVLHLPEPRGTTRLSIGGTV